MRRRQMVSTSNICLERDGGFQKTRDAQLSAGRVKPMELFFAKARRYHKKVSGFLWSEVLHEVIILYAEGR